MLPIMTIMSRHPPLCARGVPRVPRLWWSSVAPGLPRYPAFLPFGCCRLCWGCPHGCPQVIHIVINSRKCLGLRSVVPVASALRRSGTHVDTRARPNNNNRSATPMCRRPAGCSPLTRARAGLLWPTNGRFAASTQVACALCAPNASNSLPVRPRAVWKHHPRPRPSRIAMLGAWNPAFPGRSLRRVRVYPYPGRVRPVNRLFERFPSRRVSRAPRRGRLWRLLGRWPRLRSPASPWLRPWFRSPASPRRRPWLRSQPALDSPRRPARLDTCPDTGKSRPRRRPARARRLRGVSISG